MTDEEKQWQEFKKDCLCVYPHYGAYWEVCALRGSEVINGYTVKTAQLRHDCNMIECTDWRHK